MLIYLLDSNVLIVILRRRSEDLAQRVSSRPPGEVAISSLVTHELYYGAFRSEDPQAGAEGIDTLSFEVVPFEHRDARESGRVRALLAGRGQTIGLVDTLIAGQALARGLVLVTHNVTEFSRVPGLMIEDWQA